MSQDKKGGIIMATDNLIMVNLFDKDTKEILDYVMASHRHKGVNQFEYDFQTALSVISGSGGDWILDQVFDLMEEDHDWRFISMPFNVVNVSY
jgi:hypothetical protein